MEKITIQSSKGSLSAAVHRPQEKTDRLAILCPGFLDSKDYKHLVGLAEMLCDCGYVAVRFDPTGTWESEGDISDYTTTQYLDDVHSVLEYMLREREYAHVLLGGHSRGGRMAILYAARDPKISLVLGIMPSPGFFEGPEREQWEKRDVKVSQRDLPGDNDVFKEFRLPFSHVLDMDKYDVVDAVAKIEGSVALIAGELDDMVPPETVKTLFDNASEPKTFVVIPGMKHSYRHNGNEIEIVNGTISEQLKSLGFLK